MNFCLLFNILFTATLWLLGLEATFFSEWNANTNDLFFELNLLMIADILKMH